MAQNDMLKRYLDAGLAFTQMTRSRAEGIVKDLVKAGEIQREQTQERVEELVDRSRRNTEQLVELVRKEIATQIRQLGVVTRPDLRRLEGRIDVLLGRGRGGSRSTKPASAGSAAATSAPAPAPAKKAVPVKKSPAPAPAKKAAAPNKASAVKKAAPKKAAGPAKKATGVKKA
jgi:polyhydroxyalkanoate synthesis regulator phasin